MWEFSVLNLFSLVAVTARASTSGATQVMRSRTTTPRETTAGRSGLLVGVVQWKSLEGAGVRELLDGTER